jgi:hypothetical protein
LAALTSSVVLEAKRWDDISMMPKELLMFAHTDCLLSRFEQSG